MFGLLCVCGRVSYRSISAHNVAWLQGSSERVHNAPLMKKELLAGSVRTVLLVVTALLHVTFAAITAYMDLYRLLDDDVDHDFVQAHLGGGR